MTTISHSSPLPPVTRAFIRPSSPPPHTWKAQWIWQADAGPANSWMCFRTTMESAHAQRVTARIAVDSKYWLWINGNMVVREGALKRGPNPDDTWFDNVDIDLNVGKNVIAILVWFWGKQGFSHNDSAHGGLLFEADASDHAILSSSTWKALVHPSFQATEPPHPNYRLPEFNVRFDARADLGDWVNSNFDDSTWPTAMQKGVPPCRPWGRLWPRPIPQWRNSQLLEYVNSSQLIVSADGEITAKLPYNAQVTPYLEIEAPAGKMITIKTDHYCGGGNGSDFNVRAEYVTREGRQQFEAPCWMNGHAVIYSVPKEVKVIALRYRESGYDADFAGSFSCDDPFLIELWNKARRTLYVTLRDTYYDCPDRERAQWWGDTVIELEESFYAMDRRVDALTKKAILDLVRWQKPDGALFSPVPAGSWSGELPPQMLAAVSRFGFWTYLMHSGDTSFLAEAYPHVRRYLEMWHLDRHNLVVHRKGGWDWGDWGDHVDIPLIDCGWYCLALDGAEHMARMLGKNHHVPAFRARRLKVSEAFRTRFFTDEGFRSPGFSGPIDDRGNALAVCAGIAGKRHFPAVQRALATSRHASPYMEKYVLEAYYRMDRPDLAISRMKERYRPMVESELSTLWEFWTVGGWGSANHAWAGGPLSLLSQYAVGIAPTTPGYKHFHVRPQLGPLCQASATVASVSGEISVQVKMERTAVTMEITVPAGTEATVIFPHSLGNVSHISVGGVNVESKSRGEPQTVLAVGHHQVVGHFTK